MNRLNIPKLYQGIIISNLFAMIVIGINKYIDFKYIDVIGGGTQEFLMYSNFVLIPIVMGIICARFWRDLEMKNVIYVGNSILTGSIAILLSYMFLNEGTICLIIVSPLVFGFIITGVYIGKAMFRKKNNTLNVSVILLIALLYTVDTLTGRPYDEMVTDTVLIHASPAEVWKHVAAFDPITEPNHYFLFKLGMPSPMQSTVDGYYEGAHRKCIFSNGYVFDETMTTFKPGENLTFDITNQPRDPEIMGHIDILRGQFLLHDNGDGTTTLTGNSWYRLYVAPAWYYNLWAQSITSNVHIRAMQHIKQLSEAK